MDATDAEVEEAASLADIHDTILSFPDKVDNWTNGFPFLSFAPSYEENSVRLAPGRKPSVTRNPVSKSKLCVKFQGLMSLVSVHLSSGVQLCLSRLGIDCFQQDRLLGWDQRLRSPCYGGLVVTSPVRYAKF